MIQLKGKNSLYKFTKIGIYLFCRRIVREHVKMHNVLEVHCEYQLIGFVTHIFETEAFYVKHKNSEVETFQEFNSMIKKWRLI